MTNDIMKVLLSKEEIDARVVELGKEISDRFEGTEPLFIGILQGRLHQQLHPIAGQRA